MALIVTLLIDASWPVGIFPEHIVARLRGAAACARCAAAFRSGDRCPLRMTLRGQGWHDALDIEQRSESP
jgi:hypothetical protein